MSTHQPQHGVLGQMAAQPPKQGKNEEELKMSSTNLHEAEMLSFFFFLILTYP